MLELSYNYFRYWTYERFIKPWKFTKKGLGTGEYIALLDTHLQGKYNPILDVGCGGGQFVSLLASSCGIDININRLKNAKGRGATVVQGDLMKLPFPDKIFEASYTMQLLMHIPDHLITQALKELLRVTQKRILHIESYREEERKLADHCFNHDLESLYSELGVELVHSKRLDDYNTQVCSIFAPESKMRDNR